MYFVFEIHEEACVFPIPPVSRLCFIWPINFNDIHLIVILKVSLTTHISIGLTLYLYKCKRIIARDLLTLRPSNPRGNRRCKSLETHPSCWRSCTCPGPLRTRTIHWISYPLKRPGTTTVPRWTWKKFCKITAARAMYCCRLQVQSSK